MDLDKKLAELVELLHATAQGIHDARVTYGRSPPGIRRKIARQLAELLTSMIAAQRDVLAELTRAN